MDRKYRVRRGLFGKYILQKWDECPNIEMRRWVDVKAEDLQENGQPVIAFREITI
jgi:hypothetical protein